MAVHIAQELDNMFVRKKKEKTWQNVSCAAFFISWFYLAFLQKKALNPFTSIYIHILLTSLNMLYGFYCARNLATRVFDLQQNVQLSYRAMP